MNKSEMFAAMKAHIAIAEEWMKKPAAERYRPSDEYWNLAKPTFIENWPSDLYTLSIASSAVPLSLDSARVLGSYILDLGGGFDNVPADREAVREQMIKVLDRNVKQYRRGAFVRLGSRSPKDAMYWGINPSEHVPNGELKTGAQAFDLLTAGSERVYEDLQTQLAMEYQPVIWIREGIDLPEWCEFRCFMKDRELIGISQYYYNRVCPEIVNDSEGIRWAIHQFFLHDFREACHLDSVVFDVFLKRHQIHDSVQYQIKLLEINPYYALSDPCLFDWNKMDLFQGQLRYRKELGGWSKGVVNTRL